MAEKKMGKKVRKVMKNKRECVHKMVEAIIRGDSDTASDELRAYLQIATRDLILGEGKDEDDSEEMDDESEDDDDSDEDDSDDDESDEDDSDDEESDDDEDDEDEKDD